MEKAEHTGRTAQTHLANRDVILTRYIASATMVDSKTRVICCLVRDDDKVFKVKASVNNDVMDLETLVKKARKKGALRDVDPADLRLWQVSTFCKLILQLTAFG
jgi:Crinkler effector protein N-terminal domain